MKKAKRFLSMLLAFIMAFGVFSGLATTAFAASEEMKVCLVAFPRGADGNKTGWAHGSLSLMSGWTEDARDQYFAFTQDSYTGRAVYCIEPGIGVKTGDVYASRSEDFWDNYPAGYNNTISPNVTKAYIGRILEYGYEGGVSTGWNTANAADADQLGKLIATQLLIWETVVGERDSQFNHVWGSGQGLNNVIDCIPDNNPTAT